MNTTETPPNIETKTVFFPSSAASPASEIEKQKNKRVVTTKKRWRFTESELFLEKQFEYVENIHKNKIPKEEENTCSLITQQINQKIYGYKSQDQLKRIFDETAIVDIADVIEKLVECENRCFYCKTRVHILYEIVREPRQWTLDRIENNKGHNKNNVVIACLRCNLHRKTMYHERFVFTKQLTISKQP
jgi:hypothetical protein